jgi:hypothetical protein
VAFTQADVDAKRDEIAKMKKVTSYGDKSVTNFDLDQQLKLLALMEADVAASSSGGLNVSRAGFSRE